MRLVSFGSYTFPTAMVEDGFGGRDAPDTFIDTPFGPVDALAEDALDYGEDVITRSFDIVSTTPTALQTALDAARGCKGVFAALTAETLSGSAERWTYARCVNVSTKRTNRNFVWQRVTMRFRLPSALWNGTAHDTTLSISDGVPVTLTNGGNANVDDLVLYLSVASSSNASFEISKDITLDPLPADAFNVLYDGNVNAGQTLYLDSGRWLATKNGIGVWPDIVFQELHSCAGLFRLRPGANPVKIDWSGTGAVSLRYVFYDKWR